MLVGTTLASPTPMEQQLDPVGNQLVFVSSGVCLVIFGLGLLRGLGLLQMLSLGRCALLPLGCRCVR
ncbi:MAG: hypothetical protein WA902_23010 [Thermosynechococcaceae cyanobacterium]